MNMTDSNGANDGRDSQGRFQAGNPGGPGNPQVRQLAAHQAAVREALTPSDLKAVLKKLHGLAMDGDVAAARVVLDRVVGKSRHEPEAPAAWTFDSEEIRTEEGRERAIKTLLSAVADGTVPAADATALVEFIKAAGSALPSGFLEGLGLRL